MHVHTSRNLCCQVNKLLMLRNNWPVPDTPRAFSLSKKNIQTANEAVKHTLENANTAVTITV